MKTHTKGPWHWQVTALRRTLHGGPAGTTHVMACEAEDLPEGKDARLIAAAPELLEALKGLSAFVAEYFHDELVCDHSVNICGCAFRREIEAAEAAIAKAEGNT